MADGKEGRSGAHHVIISCKEDVGRRQRHFLTAGRVARKRCFGVALEEISPKIAFPFGTLDLISSNLNIMWSCWCDHLIEIREICCPFCPFSRGNNEPTAIPR